MKHIVITIILALSVFTSFSQYGDAYHAPNTLQLSLDRQRRMTAADNAHYDNMRSSNKTSSSSPISGNYNAYGWADYSGIRRQEEAGRRNQARIDEYNAKVNKLEGLIKARGLKREPKYRTQLIKATREAGFDEFMVIKLYGINEKQYEVILEEIKLAGIKSAYSGSTKTNCQGDCVETLTTYNGDVYTGNTLSGVPEGQGIYTSKNKEWVMTASFKAGLPTGIVKIDYKNGDRYEGGFENMNFNGQGKYSKKDGTYDEGNFEKSQLNGICTIKGVNYTQKGSFKNGIESGVHIITFDNDENWFLFFVDASFFL